MYTQTVCILNKQSFHVYLKIHAMFMVYFSSVFTLLISKTQYCFFKEHTMSFQKTWKVLNTYFFLYFYRLNTENTHAIHIIYELSISSSECIKQNTFYYHLKFFNDHSILSHLI